MSEIRFTPAQTDAITARGCSIAVSAAAGSGKTAVLTRRIIERIMSPDGSGDLSRILVVTFTKAAAAELISRISDAIESELAAHPENRHLREQGMLVPSAHISTIHSFCLDLIRTNFQKLGIPADFSAADETEISLMMQEIAEELISDCFEGDAVTDRPFSDFERLADTIGDVGNTDKLVSTMLSLYDTLSSTVAFLDGIDETASAMKRAAESGFDHTPWEKALRTELADFLCHYEKIYEKALSHIKNSDIFARYEEAFAFDFRFIRTALASLRGGATYRELSGLLSSYKPMRLASIRNVDFDRVMNSYKAERSEFSAGLRRLASDAYGFSDENLCEALHGTADVLSDLSILLRAFEARFSEEKHRRKKVTFTDMERFALQLLWDKKTDGPTELARAYRDAYDEIYIDEYQDTNEIQDKIFRLIARADNRFNVGDKKQSIYSFRGAEPMLFESDLSSRQKYEAGKHLSAVKIFLSENFRSGGEILDFCNGIFETLMNTNTVRYGADERLNCGSGKHSALPELCLVVKDGALAEEGGEMPPDAEAAFVADRIASYLAGPPKEDGTKRRPSDVAILLRSAGTTSEIYEKALKMRGIPCRNTAAIEFFECPEVLLVVSLLHVIDNPSRDIYLAAALKSPLYGVTLDELMYIKREYPDLSLYEALRAFTEKTKFQKGEKFLRERENYAMLASVSSCDRLIWQIYTDTGILSIISADNGRAIYEIEEARANLMMLYHYAKSFERGGFKGLSGFISYVGEIIANREKLDISQFSSPGEVVNIMTIHKSKGLEFPVCFVCELSRRFHFPELREKTVYQESLGITMKLSSSDGFLNLNTPMRMAALSERRRLAVEEELRILYVALTRARSELILTASVKQKDVDEGKFDLSETGEFAVRKAFFSSYTVKEASNFLNLLLTAAAGMTDRFRYTLVKGDELTALSDTAEEEEAKDTIPDDLSLYEAKKLVAERLDFEYPFARLTTVPSKLSVSKLYPEVLDDADEGVAEERELPTAVEMPHFLMQEPDETVTSAERGTAMHTFMQFCDFESVLRIGIEGEIRRLTELKFLFPSDGAKMNVKKLDAFFKSKLAGDMLASDRLYRERRFMIRYPASLFTKERSPVLEKEELLVQGVIDCAFFNEAGELILVDYKTDHFAWNTPREVVESTLRERHSRQLGYYRFACEKLFGTLPTHTYLYAFAIDDTVEIF